MARIENAAPAVGRSAPDFSLPDTEGRLHRPGEAPATVVIFTCNHCPYALAWHDRLIALAEEYAPRGVKLLMINSNDAQRYPRDSLEEMRRRVLRGELGQVPYLRDESQGVAAAYDAQTTPDVFVIDADGVIRYRGAPDEDYERPELGARWLREALDAVLSGSTPELCETAPVGCTIKWRS
jgi:peroxiredoxin